ncbi:hypothetical protein DQL45_03255 [Cereibacter sphaeroides 2.4.1]|nr:hypothetical protein DQL45_03255 [Cereibacter sphaeroides 2.4.1]
MGCERLSLRLARVTASAADTGSSDRRLWAAMGGAEQVVPSVPSCALRPLPCASPPSERGAAKDRRQPFTATHAKRSMTPSVFAEGGKPSVVNAAWQL